MNIEKCALAGEIRTDCFEMRIFDLTDKKFSKPYASLIVSILQIKMSLLT